jgi:opacity protein-like surface antigen
MATLVLAGAASASVQKGDLELEFLGGWSSQSGGSSSGDFSAWFVSGGIDYFLSDALSVGVGGLGSQMNLDGTSSSIQVDVGAGVPLNAFFMNVNRDITLYGVGGNAKLHFKPTGKWVPYIGAQVKWVTGKIDTSGSYAAETLPGGPLGPEQPFSETVDKSGLMYGPIGGVRIELNEHNDLFVQGEYDLWTGDISDVVDNGFGVFAGIIHQFN